jgi:hypothetical protein
MQWLIQTGYRSANPLATCCDSAFISSSTSAMLGMEGCAPKEAVQIWEAVSKERLGGKGCLALLITASTSVTKRDGFRLCLYFVRVNAGYALELVQTLDVAILFAVRDDRLCFFLCQT